MASTRCCATASAPPPSRPNLPCALAAPELSPNAQRELQAAAVLLRATHGFLFLPLLVESERAAAAALAFLQAQLGATMYPVAWPVEVLPTSEAKPDTPSQLPALRIALLGNLDDAIAKLPPNAVLVLDASSSVRQALALEAMAYINHRREPLRAAGLRFILCWPAALRQELLAHAPDMWSMRTASPWIGEADLLLSPPAGAMPEQATSSVTTQRELSPANAQKLAQWHLHHDLKAADLSPRDAVALADALDTHGQWADAAALAEAVCHAVNHPNPTALDDWAIKVQALNVLAIARHRLGNDNGALQAARAAVDQARMLTHTNPAAFEFDFAISLNNLANRLGESGDYPGALAVAREALEIRRRLAKANPKAFEPALAICLNNLGIRLSESGDRLGALAAAHEAVEIRRRLAQANPAAFEHVLAGSLKNLALSLSETGDLPGARSAATEALRLYEQANQQHAGQYEAEIAQTRQLLDQLQAPPDRPANVL